MSGVLLELAKRVEVASGPDRELDAKIARAVGRIPQSAAYEGTIKMGDMAWSNGCGYTFPAYTVSIEAVEELVPSWAFPLLDWRGCHCRLRNSLGIDFANYTGLAPTPARAMLAAALRCLSAQGPSHD